MCFFFYCKNSWRGLFKAFLSTSLLSHFLSSHTALTLHCSALTVKTFANCFFFSVSKLLHYVRFTILYFLFVVCSFELCKWGQLILLCGVRLGMFDLAFITWPQTYTRFYFFCRIDPVVQVLFQQKQELATLQHAVVSWLNKQIVWVTMDSCSHKY